MSEFIAHNPKISETLRKFLTVVLGEEMGDRMINFYRPHGEYSCVRSYHWENSFRVLTVNKSSHRSYLRSRSAQTNTLHSLPHAVCLPL